MAKKTELSSTNFPRIGSRGSCGCETGVRRGNVSLLAKFIVAGDWSAAPHSSWDVTLECFFVSGWLRSCPGIHTAIFSPENHLLKHYTGNSHMAHITFGPRGQTVTYEASTPREFFENMCLDHTKNGPNLRPSSRRNGVTESTLNATPQQQLLSPSSRSPQPQMLWTIFAKQPTSLWEIY